MKESINRFFSFTDNHDLEDDDAEQIREIPLDRIVPNPFQPRTVFAEDKIEELAQSIRTHGVIQPVIVREKDGVYELITGERRYRAAEIVGLERIPAIVRPLNDTQTASVALIENLQRESLTAIEEAMAYQKLIELHHLTQENLAQRLGKGQSTIANKMRLLQLSAPVQEALIQRKISERHARALLSLKNEDDQVQVLQQIVERDYTVKQTELLVQKRLSSRTNPVPPHQRRVSVSKDARLALNTIRQSLSLIKENGLSVVAEEGEDEEYYQFIIRIPKKSSRPSGK